DGIIETVTPFDHDCRVSVSLFWHPQLPRSHAHGIGKKSHDARLQRFPATRPVDLSVIADPLAVLPGDRSRPHHHRDPWALPSGAGVAEGGTRGLQGRPVEYLWVSGPKSC